MCACVCPGLLGSCSRVDEFTHPKEGEKGDREEGKEKERKSMHKERERERERERESLMTPPKCLNYILKSLQGKGCPVPGLESSG